MLRRALVVFSGLALAISLAAATENPAPAAKLTAAEIADRSVAASGGLQAWRAVQTLSMQGTMGVGGNQRAPLPMAVPGHKLDQSIVPHRRADEVELPFVMDLARPRKSRFELLFKGQTALQVYDGTKGWKLRPYLNRLEIEPYTQDELKAAAMQTELDGPLVDYAAKGTKIELEGMDQVEGHDNYKLQLTMKDGRTTHLWVDAQSFLQTKMEGQPRRLDGVYHPVEVYYGDYRPVDGLQIPFLIETKVLPVAKSATGMAEPAVPVEKIAIEKVQVNPKFTADTFTKPDVSEAQAMK